LNRILRFDRLGVVASALAMLSACTSTPTAPTTTVVPPVPDPPTISCPISKSVTSPLATPLAVDYTAPVVSGGLAPVTTTCTPASGSTFPVGSTTVTCTALDAKQRASSCIFTVAVTRPPQISLTKFIAFGDSITWGEDGTNPASLLPFSLLQAIQLVGQDYPTDLKNALAARYTLQASAIAVKNDGKPGEYAGLGTTLTRFSTDIAQGGQQAVLLMEGSNDVVDAYSSGSSSTNAAIAYLQLMVRAAKSAGVRPYVASIPPQNPNSLCIPICRGYAAALVPGFNSSLQTLASNEGVTFVDVYGAFGGDLTLLSTDGLHPNANGYQRIADTFFQSLKSTLEQASLVSPTVSTVRRTAR
jgi:lysophospholipase L1-like esterase